MFGWFRKNNNGEEFAKLNARIDSLEKLLTDCFELISKGQFNGQDGLVLHHLEERLVRKMNDINHNIKTIPKEITVKNVLSI